MGVSPRRPDELPADVIAALRTAQARADASRNELRAAVRVALRVGSVRQVAAALGISPTTVQAWAKGD